MNILIKNGRVIDPSSGLDSVKDVLVENGVIADVSGKIKPGKARVIDAAGLVVSPGFIDLHVHLREPGYEYKETIETGARAAAAGGFSAVCCMANSDPVNDNGSITRSIIEKAQKAGSARVYPIGAVTKGLKGTELAEMGGMKEAGAVAVSDDGNCVTSARIVRNGMEYASMFGLTLVEHCEDDSMTADGVINEGKVSAQYGMKGIPSVAEDAIVQRDILISEYTGHPVHLAHLSTRGAVDAVRRAKAKNIKVTCEAAPHHFTLTEKKLESFNANCKMNPPLRTADDVAAIREGLKDGTIDAIATDHAPHAEWEKEVEIDQAPFGVVGLETALGVALRLVEKNVLTLPDLIALFTSRPAGIFNLPGGNLRKGSPADICIFDPGKKWVVDPQSFLSKGKNSPFTGMELKGKNLLTVVGGRMVYNPTNL
ncbi:MAG: dihydroorotase [bacterium]|nr:MAG: dihydroorotase [bacterium]